ncbi:MAG: phosphomannomutase/phosphoglucomutase [bacterium]|nr:phosphomannomutase/phosphoglucomutase [bacterium]
MDALDKIFKAYDIRGIYPTEINEDIAHKIGRGTAKFLKAEKIVIGRDNRLSSDSLFKALCDGIQDEGVDILDIGITTTPIFYLVVAKYGYGGGVMISASHNPKEYNGFKIVKSGSMPVGEESGLLEIKKIIKKLKSISLKNKIKRGKLEQRDVIEHYLKNILRFVDIESIKPLKVVVDTANGAAGLVVKELDKRLPITMIHLFPELDGRFPNHQPNPMHPAATAVLQEKVLKQKADFGIAFDGDGDRILFIDEKGKRINPNYIAALIVNRFFKRAGGRISFDTPTSWVLREEIKKTGNIPICTKVGHVYLKERILRQKAIFGAESSGHYYLLEDYSVESPFFVFFKILELISKEGKSLSVMIKPFQRYFINGAVFKADNAEKKIKKVEKFYKYAPRLSLYDGLSVDYPNWHFVLRISHTEPIMRLVVEAKTQKLLDAKMKQIKSILEKK